ncbi:hypothetical protein K3495_g1282 [Podosphaera aphanis]|nr:hypothetical protein K3495_g1282 [Podosphaera aphanis]
MAHEAAGMPATLTTLPTQETPLQNTDFLIHEAQPMTSSIQPHGSGPHFSYSPSHLHKDSADISPSSSPDISQPSSPTSSASDHKKNIMSSPSRRLSLSSPSHSTTCPLSIPDKGNLGQDTFTIQELDASEYDASSSDSISIIQPHQYEDADSDLDAKIAKDFRNLTTENHDDREAFVEEMRAEKRRRRRSSVQKRTISMSIGSDTDDEDLQPIIFDANEAGSSARRLRRRVGERASLIFDDPPERIEEVDEASEEVIEIEGCEWRATESSSEDEGKLQKELPYWNWSQVMDADSDDCND